MNVRWVVIEKNLGPAQEEEKILKPYIERVRIHHLIFYISSNLVTNTSLKQKERETCLNYQMCLWNAN
jgi:hypothetical protein